ncbi:ABC-three component system protein [Paenibacillus polymyxa]|uniref:ABC-three component system protein n=1 Tax=Paenibacillus polymyxa TaxID=1406 RepID=UPI002AB528A4|nr:ABC-three component system protein [Paenibacillus polymyxa]MDY8025158.1 ABC-three component system protein [Paenibacillus polymyxa]
MSVNIHSAQAPMFGYRFQPLYALLVLWKEAEDDFDEISIETEDDVVLKGECTKLYQLKHNTKGKSGTLTVKNDGFWKTIRIWSSYANSTNHKMYFVTGETVKEDDFLFKLVSNDMDRIEVVRQMVREAQAVIKAREEAIANKSEKLPYEIKIHGCKAFMELTDHQRLSLIEKITIRPNNFNIYDVEKQVIDQLSQMVIKKLRQPIAKRLLEWWDQRLLKQNKINKTELLFQIQSFIAQIQSNNLPDDYSKAFPESVENEIGGYMEKQIDLVNGKFSRKKKAALSRWRARNQREVWIADDLLNAVELKEYDEMLIELWSGKHEPMKEDLEEDEETEEVCQKKGLELLDWIHDDSHLHINPIRSEWKQHFLIHGSFQQLSEELKVGWHPNYDEMLRES